MPSQEYQSWKTGALRLAGAAHYWGWDHCSFLLGPGVHKVLFLPSKSLFSWLCD